MDKVVILARVSTDRQEYRRQVNELKSFCQKMDWKISRLGHNTLEALKVIQILNENKVSLYIKNYSLETLNTDGSVNPVASLSGTNPKKFHPVHENARFCGQTHQKQRSIHPNYCFHGQNAYV